MRYLSAFSQKTYYDPWLLLASLSLLALGLIEVTSSSIPIAEKLGLAPFYFSYHQAIYLAIGILLAAIITYLPIRLWEKMGMVLLLGGVAALALLLVPGIGRTVNGSTRWIYLGPVSIQVSEFIKLAVIIYLAGYLVRRSEEVRTEIKGFIKPLMIAALITLLLLLEPDFGAAVVIILTVMGMLFLGGVPLRHFIILTLLAAAALLFLSFSSSYRVQRLTSFLNPWLDQFNTGYQLTQALIAFGRGGWFGTGLGGSIQKLLYLPEPHTDFLFAVLAEELGMIGGLITLLLFSLFVVRAMMVGYRAMAVGQTFAAYMAYGIGLWIGLQTLINIGVNVGVLPTKGLTLPFMSYGGSSLLVGLLGLGLLFRIDFESRTLLYRKTAR